MTPQMGPKNSQIAIGTTRFSPRFQSMFFGQGSVVDGGASIMASDFRHLAVELFILARKTTHYQRKVNLLSLAQAWLNLADHERKVQELEAETESLSNAQEPNRCGGKPN